MSTIATLRVVLGLDSRPLTAGAAQAQGSMAKLSASAQKFGISAPLAFAAAGGAVVKLASDAVMAASNLEEQLNKTSVVFEGSADSVIAFSETSASSLGIAQAAALEAAGGFGAMFDAGGLAEAAAADMAIAMVKLASDMASFNNTDPSEMLERLRSGLAGEAEPLRRYGVFISAAAVESEAFASGIATVGSELTEAQKIQARYNLILGQTTKQQGDFERTQDSLANTLRTLKAQWEDLSAEMGGIVLPLVTDLANALGPVLDTIKLMSPAIELWAKAFAIFLSPAAKAVELLSKLTPGLGDFAAELGENEQIVAMLTGRLEMYEGVLEHVKAHTDDYRAIAEGFLPVLFETAGGYEEAGRAAQGFAGALKDFADATGRSMPEVQALVAGVRDEYHTLLDEGTRDLKAFRAVSEEVMSQAASDFASWRAEAAGHLNFVSATFGDVATDFEGNANKIAEALRGALGEQRQFAQDLDTILQDGTHGSRLLVEQLLEMGPAGATAARSIATASDETRTSIEKSLAAGARMADTVAGRLQGALIGTLRDIRDLLQAIAKRWGIEVDADVTQAMSSLDALNERLGDLELKQWRATVVVQTTGGSTGFELLDMLQERLDFFGEQPFPAVVEVTAIDERAMRGFRHILDGLTALTSAVGDAVGEGMSRAFLRGAKELEAAGDDLISKLERKGDRLQRVFDRLQDRANEFGDAVRSAFDIDLAGGLAGLEELTTATASEFLSNQLAQAQSFADALTQLQEQGLSGGALEQLIGQGPEQGLEVAQLLLASPELLARFNATQTAIDELGKTTEATLVDGVFGPSLEKAAAHIERFTENAAEKMDAFAEQVRDFVQSFDRAELPEKFEALGEALADMLRLLDGGNAPGERGPGDRGAQPSLAAADVVGTTASAERHVHFHGGTFIGTSPQELARILSGPIDEELARQGGRNVGLAHH